MEIESDVLSIRKDPDIDMDMSELELLANQKKLNKQSEELSIQKVKSEEPVSSKKSKRRYTKSDSTSSYSSDSDEKYNKRKAHKENKNELIKKEKIELLYKLTMLLNNNVKFSTKVNIDNTLDDIKNEFVRIKSAVDNEKMVKFCKHGLILGIKGLEYLNNVWDPLSLDLDGWGDSLSYNMETNEYDDVLSELYEKYKGVGTMSPEMKLVMMIGMSGAMFSFSKASAKNPDMLTKMMNNLMPTSQPKSQSTSQPQPQPTSPTKSQPQLQPRPQNAFKQQAAFNLDIESEDSDNIPSKIKEPVNTFSTPDSEIIENLMVQMQNQKNIKHEQELKEQARLRQQKLDEEFSFLNDNESQNLKDIKPAAKAKKVTKPRVKKSQAVK